MAWGDKWTWEETLKAFALYLDLPTNKHDKNTPEVQALAAELGRTVGSVVFKLGNFKANDPYRAPGAVGFKNCSKLDRLVWERLETEGDAFIAEAEAALHPEPVVVYEGQTYHVQLTGRDVQALTSRRVGQGYFRNRVRENYENRCCITGLSQPGLLVASHIKPWADAEPIGERLSSANGLLLNALHDKAFDRGLITLDKDLWVVVSAKVGHDKASERLLWGIQGQQIRPARYAQPASEFIEYHNDVVFQG